MDRSRINEDFRANPRGLRTWTLYLIHVRSTWNQCPILEESLYNPRGISVDDPRGYPRNFFQLDADALKRVIRILQPRKKLHLSVPLMQCLWIHHPIRDTSLNRELKPRFLHDPSPETVMPLSLDICTVSRSSSSKSTSLTIKSNQHSRKISEGRGITGGKTKIVLREPDNFAALRVCLLLTEKKTSNLSRLSVKAQGECLANSALREAVIENCTNLRLELVEVEQHFLDSEDQTKRHDRHTVRLTSDSEQEQEEHTNIPKEIRGAPTPPGYNFSETASGSASCSKIKPKACPWVTPELRSAIQSRDRAYRRARRHPTASHIASFKESRSAIRNMLDSAKNRFLSIKIQTAHDPSACWRVLRGLGISRESKPSPLFLFSPDELNAHYAAVSRGVTPLSEEMVNYAASLPVAPDTPIFTLRQVTETEVLNSISSLCSKGTGVDNIPAKIIRLASASIVATLTAVINKSIELSYFSSSWKKAVITPLSKNNSPSTPSDTRPIAQLPEMAKVLERIVHGQFLSHLTANGLLDAHQFGFRPGRSTQTAILDLTESIRQAIDKRKVSMIVSFDFSKAFDTIPHSLLIEKLRRIGCAPPTLGWFVSYLTGRSQAIRLADGSHSSFVASTAGVPQGSILGPLLFLVFINDLSARLSSSRHMMYADDTQILCSDIPARVQVLLDNANDDVSAIVDWTDDNGIKLNANKTSAMLCGSQFFVNALKTATPPLFVQGAQLQLNQELTTLGLKLTPTLSWGPQVNRVCASVHYTLYTLRYYRHALSRTLLKRLVESMVFATFDYGSLVFYDLNKGQSLQLHRLHNACVRFVYGVIPHRAHVTPYRLALGWLSAQRRRDYNIIVLAINIISCQSPEPLSSLFMFRANRLMNRAARRQPPRELTHKAARTQIMHNSFVNTATRLLNSIPFLENPHHPPRAFKSLTRDYLFNLDVQDWKQRCAAESLEYEPLTLRDLLPPM
ncbi:unnamed protein product [Trichogramma brassicae]|uniref:Reverse transcriptase domain-containing protein n=1 Tax=Trichogramma brassicae TaxID=86971 RepID=A0A6H5J192_9HYME|nr:unnamed protein product [Trichogramma brassicae]